MTPRKKKITYGILAVICIFAGLWMDYTEKKDNTADTEISTEIVMESEQEEASYYFRNEDLLQEHYQKHGMEMGFDSMEAYEEAASAVINNPEALTKTEAEDGDFVYYVEASNEFVILSTDGYIRTYFNPDAGIDYYNRQ